MRRESLLACAALAVLSACGGTPCRSQSECPFGSYCVIEGSSGGSLAEGVCRHDCESAEDCKQPPSNLSTIICTNEGRCRSQPRPPRLTVLEPEPDTHYPPGTRTIRVLGEVRSAASEVTVSARPLGRTGCSGGAVRQTTVTNAREGTFARLPFTIDQVAVDPGLNDIVLEAGVGGAKKVVSVSVTVDCPGCAQITITDPKPRASTPGLDLPVLEGQITSSAIVPAAIWRVHGAEGDVFDGTLPLSSGRFSARGLPLFPGANRVEVLVSGVGAGLGESRCSVLVSSAMIREKGLRAILLWDTDETDLDLHVIGPSGRFGDPMSTLSIRGQHPTFGGTIRESFDAFGPETATIEELGNGVYGFIVESVVDANDTGTNALLRILYNGRSVIPGPIGPRQLTSFRGDLWVAGTLEVVNGAARWRTVDQLVPARMPPTKIPAAWPMFY